MNPPPLEPFLIGLVFGWIIGLSVATIIHIRDMRKMGAYFTKSLQEFSDFAKAEMTRVLEEIKKL